MQKDISCGHLDRKRLEVHSVRCNIELSQPRTATATPGGTFSITCKVSGYSVTDSSYATAWIRQPAGKTLEWITHRWGGGSLYQKESLKNKFGIFTDASSNSVTFKGQSVQTEDSAVYYCARRPQ
uniref:Ig-like domain-containing protein n=1 Tax=Denticeps clupeoides TaxID=299321 RepID=A0AAY4BTB9_9TELE